MVSYSEHQMESNGGFRERGDVNQNMPAFPHLQAAITEVVCMAPVPKFGARAAADVRPRRGMGRIGIPKVTTEAKRRSEAAKRRGACGGVDVYGVG